MNNIVAVETEDSRRLFIGFEPPFRPLPPTHRRFSEWVSVYVCVCGCACESILFTSARRWITHSHLSNGSCVTNDDNLALQNDLQNRELSKARCSCIRKNMLSFEMMSTRLLATANIFESSFRTINLFNFYIPLKTLEIEIDHSEALNKGCFRKQRTIWIFIPCENIGCWQSCQYCKLKCLSF